MNVRDDRGREVMLAAPPQRIVSLVPSISETLWHLGVGARLVGVTRYCTDPAEVRALPRCGGTKDPRCDAIAALRPDLIFMSEEENRLEDFERLSAAGYAIFVALPKQVGEIPGWIRRVAAAAGCEARGATLALEVEAGVRQAGARAARRPRRPRVFCPIWKRPWMSFNADTYTSSVLESCGALNVFGDAGARYCTVTLEEAAAREPEVVLLPDEPYPFAQKDIDDLGPLRPALGPVRRVRVVDGQALSWYGARTPSGLRVIEDAIFGGDA